ncbi:UvrD-helicase domain-containing protein [uncultured Salegentibacter sp.]|uniref:UvrD-helicase domain-containing protein n=1 Tax=uncultured Salegentibacter sp. TaxID=259320 RepID=UPI002597AC2C|nr:UvrD-helicase domain-containing protein [uncultured Salegentibacter sp.]
MRDFNPSDQNTVKLQGTNLVEASAGTGKTYSIGILVLRLLLEKRDLKISEILMVTFTNQAVAELAARIRKFLMEGIKAAEGKDIEEKPIEGLIGTYSDKQEVIKKLKQALIELDEASIQTIHSFCQESINSFALDSGQSFGLELHTKVMELADGYVKQFWRENISISNGEEYEQWFKGICLNDFLKAVNEFLSGKKYAFDFSYTSYKADNYKTDEEACLSYLKDRHEACLQTILKSEFNEVRLKGKWKEKFIHKIKTVEGWMDFVTGKDDAKSEKELFDGVLRKERKKVLELRQKKEDVLHCLIFKCISEVKEKVKNHLHKNQLLTYDEIIKRMHDAVTREGENPFRESIREKFKAVFIDEFQDTDKEQYEIYDRLFGEDKIVFYIGDPKQSIYGWRKADLNTYFSARSNLSETNRFKMNQNFRSSKDYVEDMNTFFSAVKNPFKTAEEGENQIKYIKVEANNQSVKGLSKDGEEVKALQVYSYKEQAGIKKSVLRLVKLLLNDGYECLWKKSEDKAVKNSDIGILVRSNAQAREIKKILSSNGIQAVTIDDTKVFKGSQEAKFLLYIMEAILHTTEANINKALLNSFTGYKYGELSHIDKEKLLDEFREYRDTWYKSGIFAAIKKYIAHFEVTRKLMERDKLRVLTNLNHILELLQEAEFRRELKPTGLYEFLEKQISEETAEVDEYEQRVESDEEAIKILTIHMAKGLEYPIVIAPFLDLQAKEIFDYCSYRDEEGIYKFYPKKKGDTAMIAAFNQQLEQENRRLLYVALTRPQYHSFIFKNTGKKNESTLLEFYEVWQNNSPIIDLDKEVKIKPEGKKLPKNFGKPSEANFNLSDHLYGKLSFSGLSVHSHTPRENNSEIKDDYDQFIFKDIPGGTNLGSMLHYLFENINFEGTPEHHQEELEKLLDKFYPHKKEELSGGFQEMIKHVLDAQIQINGEQIPMRKISNAKKRNEMEFDLRTQWVDLPGINDFDAGEGIEIRCNTQHMAKSGLLNGLIDLFFEYNGKYYILDWKSNYLGDDLSFYEGEDKMREAMNEGNYHLQYLIYTVAVKNYFEQRLTDFNYEEHFGGVIYVYLRGARAGKETGIYTNRPTLEQVLFLEKIFENQAPQPV